MQCVADCDTKHPKTFEQPVIQTLQMFIGESGCWLVVFFTYLYRRVMKVPITPTQNTAYERVNTRDSEEGGPTDEAADEEVSSSQTLIDPTNIVAKSLVDGEERHMGRKPLRGWKITLLALPAICDICGTTLMNVGLLFVAASVYQMTRGTLVLFVGLFSVIFLKRHLTGWKWASLFVVVLGVAIVGLAGALEKKDQPPQLPGDPHQPDLLLHHAVLDIRDQMSTLEAHTAAETVIGIAMIAGAQVFTASQFVLEESIMEKFSMDPIQVVGWEGVFGFLVTLAGMGILHAAVGQTAAGQGGYFDAREGFYEIFHNRAIAVTSVLIMISIGYAISITLSPNCNG